MFWTFDTNETLTSSSIIDSVNFISSIVAIQSVFQMETTRKTKLNRLKIFLDQNNANYLERHHRIEYTVRCQSIESIGLSY